MGAMSVAHWLIILVIVLVLFGANKIPRLMGDMAKGIKAFQSGLKEDEGRQSPEQAKAIPASGANELSR